LTVAGVMTSSRSSACPLNGFSRIRPLFWLFVVAFNLVGTGDLLLNYYHATRVHLPEIAGQLGAAYVIPVIYVPALMITHVAAFYLLARQSKAVWSVAGEATAP
jgi:hypothetical protein